MPDVSPLPEVSLLMPVLNAGRYVQEAIDSVLAQQDVRWELIIIDGGSEDNTCALLEAHRQLPKIHAETHPGANQSAALGIALAQARGEVVVFLDGDDRLVNGALRQAVDAFGPGIDLVYGAARRFDDRTGETVGIGHTRVRSHLEDTLLTAEFCTQATCWKRDILLSLGGPRPELELAMHVDLWARYLVRHGQQGVFKLDALLGEQRMRADSKIALDYSRLKQEKHAMWRDLFKALEAPAEMLAYCDALTPYDLPSADWQPSEALSRNRFLAGFCEQVVRLYYYDGAYDSARNWLARAKQLNGFSLERFRLAAKLAMKKERA